MHEKEYTNDDLKRDMRILKVENAIQTLAVIAVFFWGIVTINDVVKKFKG